MINRIRMRIRIKYIKYIAAIVIVAAMGLQVQSDDKELFMGMTQTVSRIKPNVVILADSSGSMNTIMFYPKLGLDGTSGTADDGYNPTVSYAGSIDYPYSTSGDLYFEQTQWIGRYVSGTGTSIKAEDYTQAELENINGKNYWTGCYAGDGTGTNFQVGTNQQNFAVGDAIMFNDNSAPFFYATAKIKRKYTLSGNPWVELENVVGGPIAVNGGYFMKVPPGYNRKPVLFKMYGYRDVWGSSAQCQQEDVRWPKNYIKWMFMHTTDAQKASLNHFATYATFDTTKTPDMTTTPSFCDQGNGQRIQQLWTRIQVAREVLCKVARDSSQIVQLGLFQFEEPPNQNYCSGGGASGFDTAGATLVEGIGDMSDASSLQDFKTKIWGVKANAWTPLAESLADIWKYYKPGPASKTYWPVDYELDNGIISVNNANSDIEYWCQNNYVVIMTDGESTMDKFTNSKYTGSIFRTSGYPCKRTEPWSGWTNGWGDTDNNDPIPASGGSAVYCPNSTCWISGSNGTDYLDDVAYFLRHQDLFPDEYFGTDPVSGWPGEQHIYTYVIGFNAENDMLKATALNGEGAYYTANNYETLVDAFQNVITSINLRNFGFSSITAPRKTATATNDELTVSYVGYFMPSTAASIWEGHLLAFKLEDAWGYDEDDNGEVASDEFVFKTQEECLNMSGGKSCSRLVALNLSHLWDVADPGKIPTDRSLYTHNSNTTTFAFNTTYQDTLKPLFGSATTDVEAQQIITKIRQPQFADVFHSDVGFVSAPSIGKKYLPNIDPTGETDETYAEYQDANKDRTKVLYTGTNDGILHMLYADGVNAGKEAWGFIPDEVLPSLRKIVIDGEHTYTVDGRMSFEDIYFKKPSASKNTWSTIMVMGLRSGGRAYYGLDITTITSFPTLLWKFKDNDYSGESWGIPVLGKIRIINPDNPNELVDKWVAILAGGFAFNSENSNNSRGKSFFVVDASNGELLWMIGYNKDTGATDSPNTDKEIIEVTDDDITRHLTSSDLFNFSIPSSLTAIDKDNNGYLDAVYFGNVGGHFFKTDISNNNRNLWTTYTIYKTDITTKASTKITSISGNQLTLQNKVFEVGEGIRGVTSNATAYIVSIDNKVITVQVTSGTFQSGENIVCRTYDPIYQAPSIAFDNCYQLWMFFGTGDRDRPRTNPTSGRFIGIKDNGFTKHMCSPTSTIQYIPFGGGNEGASFNQEVLNTANGWYFTFLSDVYEKLFDPEPIVIPDKYSIPHILFNTYTPPNEESLLNVDNPCDAPQEGTMTLYDIAITTCGSLNTNLTATRETGRIAGGGGYQGKEYVIYKSTSGKVADVPGADDSSGATFQTQTVEMPFPGGIIFWKEKKK